MLGLAHRERQQGGAPPRTPIFLRAWGWLASLLQNSPPRNHAELLLTKASKVRSRSLGSFILALLEIFQACMI